MYIQGQTLRHKKTNILARLVPQTGDLNWYCPGNNYTLFYKEDGTTFTDKLKNFTYINDEFGRPLCGQVENGQYVDIKLKRYLVSKEELLKLREKSLARWEEKILVEIKTKGSVQCPFSDGSKCTEIETYFLKKHNGKPLHKSYNCFTKEFDFVYCRQYIMKIYDKVWLYDEQMNWIVPTSLKYLKGLI